MITLECNYSKKIGLPGYSSHQFGISLKTELTDASQVKVESARLYKLLQTGVDNSIRETGYLPGKNGNGHSNGNGHHTPPENDRWNCSDKQRELILKITEEHQLDKTMVDDLAQERFGHGVRQLNKLEASGLIDELLEKHGDKKPGRRPFQKAGGR
jgi:hypothetical protein